MSVPESLHTGGVCLDGVCLEGGLLRRGMPNPILKTLPSFGVGNEEPISWQPVSWIKGRHYDLEFVWRKKIRAISLATWHYWPWCSVWIIPKTRIYEPNLRMLPISHEDFTAVVWLCNTGCTVQLWPFGKPASRLHLYIMGPCSQFTIKMSAWPFVSQIKNWRFNALCYASTMSLDRRDSLLEINKNCILIIRECVLLFHVYAVVLKVYFQVTVWMIRQPNFHLILVIQTHAFSLDLFPIRNHNVSLINRNTITKWSSFWVFSHDVAKPMSHIPEKKILKWDSPLQCKMSQIHSCVRFNM